MNAVAAARRTLHDLVQEYDIPADFCDIDIQIAYARELTFQHRQLVIVRCKQSPDVGVRIAEILTSRPRDG